MKLCICVGSYERVLIGLDFDNNRLEQIFGFSPHLASIRSVASCSKYLASGSADEVIRLFDLTKNKELGSLLKHSGAVTTLAFHESSHLISGSEDGKIVLWRTKDWEMLKVLRGNKAAVNDVCIHPSGKLALSVGKDKSLRCWNLQSGCIAYCLWREIEAECVKFSKDGNAFVVGCATALEMWDTTSGEIKWKVNVKGRIGTCAFIGGCVAVSVGGDVKLLRLENGESVLEFNAHDIRVKGMVCTRVEEREIFVTVGSDGYCKVWELTLNGVAELATYNCGTRLTCVTCKITE